MTVSVCVGVSLKDNLQYWPLIAVMMIPEIFPKWMFLYSLLTKILKFLFLMKTDMIILGLPAKFGYGNILYTK